MVDNMSSCVHNYFSKEYVYTQSFDDFKPSELRNEG